MIEYNLEQRSKEWLEWRKTGIGSSDAPVLWFGKHFSTTTQKLWRQKVGLDKKDGDSFAMARGRKLESHIISLYEAELGVKTRSLCCSHDHFPFIKSSLDGWVDEYGVVLEAKAPNATDHQSALDNIVPEKYKPQLDHHLLATGSAVCHYVSYSNYFPEGHRFALVSYERDEQRLEELLGLELAFWDMVIAREWDGRFYNPAAE